MKPAPNFINDVVLLHLLAANDMKSLCGSHPIPLTLTCMYIQQTDTFLFTGIYVQRRRLLNLGIGETRNDGSGLSLCMHGLQELRSSAGRDHHVKRTCTHDRAGEREGHTTFVMARVEGHNQYSNKRRA